MMNYEVYRDFDSESITRKIRMLGDRIVNVHCFTLDFPLQENGNSQP